MKKQIGIKSLNLTDLLNEETEFLPLMSDEDEAKISKEDAQQSLQVVVQASLLEQKPISCKQHGA